MSRQRYLYLPASREHLIAEGGLAHCVPCGAALARQFPRAVVDEADSCGGAEPRAGPNVARQFAATVVWPPCWKCRHSQFGRTAPSFFSSAMVVLGDVDNTPSPLKPTPNGWVRELSRHQPRCASSPYELNSGVRLTSALGLEERLLQQREVISRVRSGSTASRCNRRTMST